MKFKELFRKKPIQQIIDESDWAEGKEHKLVRNLRFIDLTSLAIAAIIGAGIFSTIGTAAVNGGPAISLLFIITAVACAFSALCYAEFSSRVPISGSAYTYSYVALGEIFAWIIGWDLIMEYSVGNIAVAISWSDYFTSLMNGLGLHIPDYLAMDYWTAQKGFKEVSALLSSGTSFKDIPLYLQESYTAWHTAPTLGGMHLIADIPAFMVTVFITWLVYTGIRESKIAGNLMVLLKLCVILMVISIGAFYVKPENWTPFAPNGFFGVIKGVSAVFFAYIGFDAISTTAEECKNPQKDLPKAMITSLIICTILYVLIALVLTGMVNYKYLNVGDPLAFVFKTCKLDWISGIISLSAIIAMASVLLVFQIGQPRIWMSMSRDGLLPPRFSKIHPKFKTPAFSTILTGIIVAVPSLFLNLVWVTDLTSIGTLFAFILVCAGVLFLDKGPSKYKVPYINSRFILPLIFMVIIAIIYYSNSKAFMQLFNVGGEGLKDKILFYIFVLVAIFILIQSVCKKYSLIPVLGLLINLYLISELGITNWLRFLIWMVIGLVIYLCYGMKKSKFYR
ncbi:MAG: amino acid permease [Bacteroidales bacterium]|nr:amino acid permease [Bacteroidales bacterium]